eukprot:gb/GEZN01008200.1/.p1 GENE.gb/GEZN01008200.1/~~gb/GEZN01008200.1/.p1  ORF type:complete len:451 (-),score=78.58 gb/GEZN01008200.1/:77-1429(-)
MRSHRALKICRGTSTITLLVDDGTPRSRMLEAIQDSFGFAKESRVILTDSEGCDVPLDSRLATGRYVCEEVLANNNGPTEIPLDADPAEIMRALLGYHPGSGKVIDGVIVQVCSSCKIEPAFTLCEDCESVFCSACNTRRHEGVSGHRQSEVSSAEADAVQERYAEQYASHNSEHIRETLDDYDVPPDVQLLLMERMGIPATERKKLMVAPSSLRHFTDEEIITLDTEMVEDARLKELQSSMAREAGVYDELEAEMAEEFGMDASDQAFTAQEKWILDRAIRKARKALKSKLNLRKKAPEFVPGSAHALTFSDKELVEVSNAIHFDEDLKHVQAGAELSERARTDSENTGNLTAEEETELERALDKTRRRMARKLRHRMVQAQEFVPSTDSQPAAAESQAIADTAKEEVTAEKKETSAEPRPVEPSDQTSKPKAEAEKSRKKKKKNKRKQ